MGALSSLLPPHSPRPSCAISTLEAVEGSEGASVFTRPVYKGR
jgi:hypothetical protein